MYDYVILLRSVVTVALFLSRCSDSAWDYVNLALKTRLYIKKGKLVLNAVL